MSIRCLSVCLSVCLSLSPIKKTQLHWQHSGLYCVQVRAGFMWRLSVCPSVCPSLHSQHCSSSTHQLSPLSRPHALSSLSLTLGSVFSSVNGSLCRIISVHYPLLASGIDWAVAREQCSALRLCFNGQVASYNLNTSLGSCLVGHLYFVKVLYTLRQHNVTTDKKIVWSQQVANIHTVYLSAI